MEYTNDQQELQRLTNLLQELEDKTPSHNVFDNLKDCYNARILRRKIYQLEYRISLNSPAII